MNTMSHYERALRAEVRRMAEADAEREDSLRRSRRLEAIIEEQEKAEVRRKAVLDGLRKAEVRRKAVLDGLSAVAKQAERDQRVCRAQTALNTFRVQYAEARSDYTARNGIPDGEQLRGIFAAWEARETELIAELKRAEEASR